MQECKILAFESRTALVDAINKSFYLHWKLRGSAFTQGTWWFQQMVRTIGD